MSNQSTNNLIQDQAFNYTINFIARHNPNLLKIDQETCYNISMTLFSHYNSLDQIKQLSSEVYEFFQHNQQIQQQLKQKLRAYFLIENNSIKTYYTTLSVYRDYKKNHPDRFITNKYSEALTQLSK